MKPIDLNADVGEGCDDLALLPYLTSVNIACGGHAGDAETMRATATAAAAAGLALGAHPSYPDRLDFGRRELDLPLDALLASLRAQIVELVAIVASVGARLQHVKPHGALYHRVARDREVAAALAALVRDIDPTLALVCLPGSALLAAAAERGLPTRAEGFIDRRYRRDGSLVPRGEPGAVIADVDEAIAQALALARGEPLRTADGGTVRVAVDTLCLHSDTPGAAALAARVAAALRKEGQARVF